MWWLDMSAGIEIFFLEISLHRKQDMLIYIIFKCSTFRDMLPFEGLYICWRTLARPMALFILLWDLFRV